MVSRNQPSGDGERAAATTSELSAAGDLTAPYVPVAIHFEEPDTLDFVERDVPTITRPVYAGLDVLLDAGSREPIGWRVYGWSRIAPRDAWQPIETAPRDGTRIDLWVPGRGRLADRFWSPKGSITRGGWGHRVIRHRRWVSMIGTEVRPTHWMPLPEAPR